MAAEAAARASMPVYVSGYLALYGMGDGGELVLTREQVARALPPAAPLPINIDHVGTCEVGEVLAIVDDDTGVFFVGVINCPQLADVLSSVAHPEFFGDDAAALTPRERFLYLVSNYLPSASLSSRRLAPGEEADGTLFAHVALCVLGRRVGTIVTYDATPEASVAPFRRLSPAARAALLADAETARAALGDRAWAVDREALARTLLSTAVNNMLVRDKWNTVARRRREAGIAGHTYLQASAVFRLVGGEEPPAGGGARERAQKRAPAASVCIALPVADGRALQPELPPPESDMSGAHPAPAPAAHPAPVGDYVYVPTAQYNQLVVSQARAGAPPPPYFVPGPPVAPGLGATAPLHTAGVPWGPGYGFPPAAALEGQLMALAGAIADSRRLHAHGADGPGEYDGAPERRCAKRRRYNWDAPRCRGDDEPAYYPGEGPPADAAPPYYSRHPPPAAHYYHHSPPPHPSPPPPPAHALSKLASAVASLQQEVSQLRAGHSHGPACAPAPSPAPAPQPGPPVAPPPLGAGPSPAPAPAAPGPAPAGLPEELRAAATVDASAVSGLPPPAATDAAEIFVAQMMRHR
ncbi:Capsid scaffolding protein [Caprine alphaherpesvirus 1]|uniref:Capsid scaffolding protein n=1 Tax=Caprine alphaherpesvirus 1 TaxID=39944 RepID=A0AAE6D031_9ALPH|nr:Capsid scaffolding protein [Caprine alphaherpesvirus 1]QBM10874.1 Capsid scaffolding protein [Caprine alphaherpesvirus 1]